MTSTKILGSMHLTGNLIGYGLWHQFLCFAWSLKKGGVGGGVASDGGGMILVESLVRNQFQFEVWSGSKGPHKHKELTFWFRRTPETMVCSVGSSCLCGAPLGDVTSCESKGSNYELHIHSVRLTWNLKWAPR